ncbi:hypothetical protein VFPBJ_08483 [Purpureocillium lilacinum]|uniref:Uncharacterized protein n=1 Tax=Purpureocillium lilacinum TaxID=33203 RepID=A0A179GFH7_PURLI|nr:hypothetical protein VFPBJ_08483 [Purpureocillium lilacinum]
MRGQRMATTRLGFISQELYLPPLPRALLMAHLRKHLSPTFSQLASYSGRRIAGIHLDRPALRSARAQIHRMQFGGDHDAMRRVASAQRVLHRLLRIARRESSNDERVGNHRLEELGCGLPLSSISAAATCGGGSALAPRTKQAWMANFP